MSRFVALLRGINVGKAKRVAMADLRELLATLGYGNVRTLLNSGNALFDATTKGRIDHGPLIQRAIAAQLGVDAPVVVKSARDIAAAIAGNPLAAIATDPSRLLVAFTRDAQSLVALGPLAAAPWGDEAIHVGKDAAYVWCPDGILESKAAAALQRLLGPSGTTRNWATVEKIHRLLQHGSS
jgi:uncharacterized protein (DUF1697 family)